MDWKEVILAGFRWQEVMLVVPQRVGPNGTPTFLAVTLTQELLLLDQTGIYVEQDQWAASHCDLSLGAAVTAVLVPLQIPLCFPFSVLLLEV